MASHSLIADAHAHFFPATMCLPDRWAGEAWLPTLAMDDSRNTGRIMLGTRVFRSVTDSLWDLEARLAVLDAHGVSLQLVSPTPVLLNYTVPAQDADWLAREVNTALADQVRASAGRIVGLGTVPLQDPDLAVAGLEHVIRELGLAGVELGPRVGDMELDDPALSDFYAAAEELGAVLYIHPLDGGGGAIRRSGPPFDFGLGMVTDTAMAATALIFGGVLDAHPALRIALTHGCGSFPWVAPRLKLYAALTGDTERAESLDATIARLYADTLVFDEEHLRLLVRRFGSDHVMLGTDFPFISGQLESARDLIASAVASGGLTRAQAEAIKSANLQRFLRVGVHAD